MVCPIKNQDWNNIVAKYGEDEAYRAFVLNSMETPTFEEAERLLGIGSTNIKPGVEELFETDSNLANQVYEALGFNEQVINVPNKEVEFLLHSEKLKINLNEITLEEEGEIDLNLKNKWNTFAIKAQGKKLGYIQVLAKDDNTVKIGLSALYEGKTDVKKSIIDKLLELINNIFNKKKVEVSDKKINVNAGKGIGKLAYELLAVKLKEEYQKELISDTSRTDYAENLWKSFEKQGKAEVIGKTDTQYRWDYYYKFNVGNQITPQQKQQAQQLYAQYLEQNPNGSVEQFKSWVKNFNNQNTKKLNSDVQLFNQTKSTNFDSNNLEDDDLALMLFNQAIGLNLSSISELTWDNIKDNIFFEKEDGSLGVKNLAFTSGGFLKTSKPTINDFINQKGLFPEYKVFIGESVIYPNVFETLEENEIIKQAVFDNLFNLSGAFEQVKKELNNHSPETFIIETPQGKFTFPKRFAAGFWNIATKVELLLKENQSSYIQDYLSNKKKREEVVKDGKKIKPVITQTLTVNDNIVKNAIDLIGNPIIEDAIKSNNSVQIKVFSNKEYSEDGIAGWYITTENVIYLHESMLQPKNILEGLPLIAHELIHSVTSQGLLYDEQFSKEIRALLKIVKDKSDIKDFYGFKNEHEFLSEAFSSPEFRELLKTTKFESVERLSIWQKFVNVILKFLNKNQKYTEKNTLISAEEILNGIINDNKHKIQYVKSTILDKFNSNLGSKQDIEGFKEFVGNSNQIKQANTDIVSQKIASGEVEIIDEDSGRPCAANGMTTANFTPGSRWKLLEDLKGPSHAKGGIDIDIAADGAYILKNGGRIKAEYGLLLSNRGGGLIDPPKSENVKKNNASIEELDWDKYEEYVNKKNQYSTMLEQEKNRVSRVRNNILQAAENRLKNPIARTDLGWIPEGERWFCASHACEVMQDAGVTTPESYKSYKPNQKIPLIPGNAQLKSKLKELGFTKVDKPEPGDYVQEEYGDYPVHSLIYSGDNNYYWGSNRKEYKKGTYPLNPDKAAFNYYRYEGNIPMYDSKLKEVESNLAPYETYLKGRNTSEVNPIPKIKLPDKIQNESSSSNKNTIKAQKGFILPADPPVMESTTPYKIDPSDFEKQYKANVHSSQQKKYEQDKSFHEEYLKSPRYKEMLENSYSIDNAYYNPPSPKDNSLKSFSKNMEKAIIEAGRKRNFEELKERPTVSFVPFVDPKTKEVKESVEGVSYSSDGSIVVFPSGFEKPYLYTHEILHSIDRPLIYNYKDNKKNKRLIPQADQDYIKAKALPFELSLYYQQWKDFYPEEELRADYKEHYTDYVGQPTEVRARLQEIRKEGKEKNIYDPFTQKVDKKSFRKLKEATKNASDPYNHALNTLLRMFREKDVINMLNTISNSNTNDEYKTTAKNGLVLSSYKLGGDIPTDPLGYLNPENIGNPVKIPSNKITMKGVKEPLLGVSDAGDVQLMTPENDYSFVGKEVTEYPLTVKDAIKKVFLSKKEKNKNNKK